MLGNERIRETNIEEELRSSYLRYAMSVIVDRALPDVRDGLKPSQRRILVAMNDLGLGPRAKSRKCAKIAGDTSGNYHPHGESVIYPTLVRMAQSFNMRTPLVIGQGNFGNVDGDPPAAMRYTEAKMSGPAMELLADLEKETVDFRPNYDETRLEPTVLPGLLPNLLVNGASGIAVAMASSIPPHNLGEVCDAITALLRKPDITVDALMKFVPGPDFPTGGRICGRGAIRDAYTTGRGILEVRAKCHVESGRRGLQQVVVDELPFQVNRKTLTEKIAQLAKDDKISGIADIVDESADDTRLCIVVKRGEDPEIVLNQLYKYTQLRESFSVIAIALVDGKPELLDLKRMLEQYVRHRKDVITRRTRHLLAKAEEREHIVVGLLKAIDVIDKVIALIRKSKDVASARDGLVEQFAFTVLQAEAILRMQLQRLTGLERKALEAEHADLLAKIAEYRAILGDERLVLQIIEEDMAELKSKYADPRRTEISDAVGEFDLKDLVQAENVAVTLSHEGYIKRTALDTYRKQQRGGKGIIGGDAKEGDFMEHLLIANTHDWMLCFTDRGRVYKDQVLNLPDLGRYAKGRAIVNFLEIGGGERVQALLPVRDLEDTERSILFATRKGYVKRTSLSQFQHIRRGGIIALGLEEGDAVVGVTLVRENQQCVLVTAKGMAIRFVVDAGSVRTMGREAFGVIGIRLEKADRVVDMALVDDTATLLTVCENGYGKRTSFEEYLRGGDPQGRGGSGLKNLSPDLIERNGDVIGAKPVTDADDVICITEKGQTIRLNVSGVRVIGRSTGGVRLMELADDDRIVSVARVPHEEDASGDGQAPLPLEGGTKAPPATPAPKGDEPEAPAAENPPAKPAGPGPADGGSTPKKKR
jgi:DNA gyrase subunit A